jgi:TolB-like protein/class 3 adenylate cyclase/Tfp pilus assembly protein PilF
MTNDAKLEHRLAAIMATDVVGYSQSMQADEAGTLAALGAIRQATDNQIREHHGRIANTAGDSVVAEFGSAVQAVSCAMALQQELSSRTQGADLQVRIGIHLGDVVEKDGDLFGTAVNVAARLEGIAQPGAVVVSAAVRDAIAGKVPTSFTDLGLNSLKNIEEPIRVYALSPRSGSLSSGVPRAGEALPLPVKPSIAVLPFENLSGDREQEYFADGMVEEIITALSRFRQLFVIARNSSFAYKGRAVDVKQVGKELGVRYILEGSVRKAGTRVRIAGQLIDTSTGAHLWADRFDGAVEDIFDLQDQVTASVVAAIGPKLEQAEIDRAKRKPTENLDAYDHYLRGLAAFHQWTREANAEALASFSRAIDLDTNFAAAYAMAARCFAQRKGGWSTDREQEAAETLRLARRAVKLGKEDAVALGSAGMAFSFVVGDHDYGRALTDRAVALNPNLALAWLFSGWVRVWRGETEAAIDRIGHAMRLNPNDPLMYVAMATAHLLAGRYAEASSCAEEVLQEHPNHATSLRVATASYALAGRLVEAQKTLARLLQVDPASRVSNLGERLPLRRPEDFAKMAEGMRLAGLQE